MTWIKKTFRPASVPAGDESLNETWRCAARALWWSPCARPPKFKSQACAATPQRTPLLFSGARPPPVINPPPPWGGTLWLDCPLRPSICPPLPCRRVRKNREQVNGLNTVLTVSQKQKISRSLSRKNRKRQEILSAASIFRTFFNLLNMLIC